jgi:hypothetical protein
VWNGYASERYCASTPQSLIHSVGSVMMVRLWSNVLTSSGGFVASYGTRSACTTNVSVGAVIDWKPPSVSNCAAVAVLPAPTPTASNLVLTVTNFTVACPALVVIRSGAGGDDPIIAAYCGTKSLPFTTPSVNATALHVAFVGASASGAFTATVAAQGRPRRALSCAGSAAVDSCTTGEDHVITNQGNGCLYLAADDVDADDDADIVCLTETTGVYCCCGGGLLHVAF